VKEDDKMRGRWSYTIFDWILDHPFIFMFGVFGGSIGALVLAAWMTCFTGLCSNPDCPLSWEAISESR